MSAKSLWNWITNRAAAGTPANNSLFPFAPQPGTSLVSEAKHCTAADIVAAGGGAADIGIRKVSATLLNADIIALPTTPFQILAGVANSYIVPLMSFWEINTTAGVYTNIDADGFMGLGADGSASGTQDFENVSTITGAIGLTAFLGNMGNKWITPLPAPFGTMWGLADAVTRIVISSWTNEGAPYLFSDWKGQPWRVECNNGGSGNFTGGNVANRMAVTFYYAILAAVLP